MNYLLIRHLILKDVRHQRIRLLLIWLMALLLPLINFYYYQDEHLNDLLTVTEGGMLLLFCFLIIFSGVSTILLDPTCGSARFLTTRPIKWTVLLASKVLFVLLFLWLPIVILRLATIYIIGVYLSFADQALHLLEITVFVAAAAAIFVLPALFFQRLTTVILTIVGCILFGYIFAILGSVVWSALSLDTLFAFPTSAGASGINPHLYQSLRISSYLVICAIMALTIIPVSILRYWKPSLAIPVTLVFAGFYLCGMCALLWTYPLDQCFSDAPKPSDELPSPLHDQVRLTMQNPSWDVSRSWAKSDYEKFDANKKLEFRLQLKTHLEGIERPLFCFAYFGPLEVTLASGRKIKSANESMRSIYPFGEWLYDCLRMECAGMMPTNPNFKNFDQNGTYTFYAYDDSTKHPRPDISDFELQNASFQTTATFRVVRIKILKIMPFKPGARLDLPRQSHEIRQIATESNAIRFLSNISFIPIILRGDLERLEEENTENPSFVIINRRTGEILSENIDSGYVNPFAIFSLRWEVLTKSLPHGVPKNEPPAPIPPHWLDDADICFYQFESLGGMDLPCSSAVTNIIH